MSEEAEQFERSLGSLKKLFFTALADHVRDKRVLKNPFHKLGKDISFTSWKDSALPLYSWCALTVALLPRDDYLEIFRKIATRVKHRHDRFGENIFLNHSSLAQITNTQFDFIFEPLLQEKELRPDYFNLSNLKELPDRAHWERYGEKIEDAPIDFGPLAVGYSLCFDHQSQQSTDIRWLIIMNFMANDRLIVDPALGERVQQIIEYPNLGDMKSVRPSIRAMEIMFRGDPDEKNDEKKKEKHAEISEKIWDELYEGTRCLPLPFTKPKTYSYAEALSELVAVYREILTHFHASTQTTGIDARHDTAFGLILYALALCTELLLLRAFQRVAGRLLLRSIVEAHINLRFLRTKDDPTIWFQFRNYGSSQAKLAFLKYLDAKAKPDYVDIQELHQLANDDMWLEFQDINLGSWASKSVRELATEAGLKATYDQHYPILSSPVHAQWPAVKETVFTQCVNPLHRFHRIPSPPRASRENLVADASKLVNQMLGDLNQLYPSFKSRLRKYKDIIADPDEDEDEPGSKAEE
jgi:hypothetical protein